MDDVVSRILDRADHQYRLLVNQAPEPGQYPAYINPDGTVQHVRKQHWMSGYFPGTMWYLYAYTGDAYWIEQAMRWCEAIESEKHATNKHDTGVMLYLSFGLGHLIGGVEAYRDVVCEGAASLLQRFSETVGLIRSWDFSGKDEKWEFPVIIDGLIMLDLPFYAALLCENHEFARKADTHALNTLKHHLRPDGSTPHVVDYDPATGEKRLIATHQGVGRNSSWSRGQAWVVYGFPLAHRYTGRAEYLAQAMKTTDYCVNHRNMPEDLVPYWDYEDPAIPHALRDVSAAAIMCAGLIELCARIDGEERRRYLDYARRILQSLSTDRYLCAEDECHGFLLKHSVYHKPAGLGVDTPVNFADFYLVEACMRYREMIAAD